MNQMIQMLLNQKIQQIPNGMMKQMESQLKRINPQAFNEFQQARKNNTNPNEYLNKIVGGFSPEKKQQWESMIGGINLKG